MKKSGGIIKLVIAIAVIAIGVTAGVKIIGNITDSPKSTIEKFEKSFNALDIDGVIECFDPSVQKLYSGANSLLGSAFGMNISDLSSLAPFISEFDDDISADDMPKISIDVTDVDKTSKNTATVYCDIKYSDEIATNETIEMVKIDGEWYISGQDLLNGMF